jgi:protein-tyrosine phosphatase
MAEGLFRDHWRKLGRDDLVVSSMGVHGLDSSPATEHAVTVCREHGIDISEHRSRQLVPEELSAAHLIFTMDRVQREYVQLFFPVTRGNVHLLGAWPGKETRKSEVKDPIGGPVKVYRRTFDTIQAHVDRIIPAIVEIFG